MKYSAKTDRSLQFNEVTRSTLSADAEGYVSKKEEGNDTSRSSTSRVTTEPETRAPEAEHYGKDGEVHRFDLGINTDGYAPLLHDLMETTDLSTLVAEELAVYPEDRHLPLRKLLGARFGLGPDNVVITAGLVSAIDMAARVFLSKGDSYLLPVPNFFVFESYSTRTGATPIHVRLDRHPDLQWDRAARDEAIRVIERRRPKMAWISNPTNPSGQFIPQDIIEDIVAAADRCDTAVVVDEAFGEYSDTLAGPVSAARLARKHTNLMVFRSFSKMYGLPGARLGYIMCASPEIITALNVYRQYFSSTWLAKLVSRIAKVDDASLEEVRRITAGRRNRFLAELSRIPGYRALPSRTNTLMIRHEHPPYTDLWERLAIRSVLTADLNGVTGIRGKGWIRATIQDDAKNKHLLRALEEAYPEHMKVDGPITDARMDNHGNITKSALSR